MGVAPERAAAQGVYGPSGLIVHPTAFTQEPGTYNVYGSYLIQEQDGLIEDFDSHWRGLGVSAGVHSNFQIGAIFLSERPEYLDEQTSFGAFVKYRLRDDGPTWNLPAISLVGNVVLGDLEMQTLSIVASHAIPRSTPGDPPRLVTHLGIEVAARTDLPDKRTGTSVFGAVEFPLSSYLRAVAEGGTRFRFEQSERLALSLFYGKTDGDYNVVLGSANAGRSDEMGFFFGIGFPFGGEGRGKGGRSSMTIPGLRRNNSSFAFGQ